MTSEAKLLSNPAQAVRDESAGIQGEFMAGGDAASVLSRRTRLVDTVLATEYLRLLAPAFPAGLALLAVGGYGRRELFPHSDIDLMFLVPEGAPAGAAKEALAAFMRTIWDYNLRLSHSVHSIRECCEIHEGNIELTVSLIDGRFLGGDELLYQGLTARLPKFLQSQRATISRQLCRLAHQRAALRTVESFEAKSSSLLAGFRDWRSRLSNAEFTVARDRVLFRSPQQLEKDPEIVLRLFLLVGRHKVALHPETERKLAERLPALTAWFSEPRPIWPVLREILSLPHASSAVRAMHDSGVLRALFPEWGQIECYVVRDFNHRYTVDEHTLVTLESLEELAASEVPERRRFGNLMREIEDPSILRLALLFHDVGKGGESDSHAVESARVAELAAERIGVPPESLALLRALIAQHLVLSSAMSGRDLDDPTTARWLADRAGTIEVLKSLTLLTFADTSAVHPTAMSPWRLEQLWRVYVTAHRELTRELDTDRIQSAPASAEREAFLKGFPTRYLRIHSDAEIAYHMELDAQRRETGMSLDVQRRGGVYHLTVVAKDRLFLFASMAGALASFGMNILRAEAFANQQGTILDTFAFSDPQRTLELNPPDLDRLRQTLERVLLGRLDVKTLLRNRPIPSLPSKNSGIPSRVSFDNEASDTATLVEVVTQDRPGLLYDLASAISEAGCSIEVVLVDTEAHKALDVFYVTANGRKLEPALRDLLRAHLVGRAASI